MGAERKGGISVDFTPYIGTIVTVAIAFLSFYGAMASRFSRMEEKVDHLAKEVEKHNSVVERTAGLERDLHTAWVRIDEHRDEIRRLEEKKADK